MNSASNQKLNKLELSDSFDSNENLSETSETLENLIDEIFLTLIQSKTLPKESKRPEYSMSSLDYLVNTLCDEFLLEIDLPTARTHCSTEENAVKTGEVSVIEDEDVNDLMNRVFFSSQPVFLSAASCKVLKSMFFSLLRNPEQDNLQQKLMKVNEKVSIYAEALLNYSIKVKEKDNEIERLKKELEELKRVNFG
jgi:hypothetical protein